MPFNFASTDELHGLLLSKQIQLTNRKKSSSESSSFQALNTSANILPFPASNPTSQVFVAQALTFTNEGRGMGIITIVETLIEENPDSLIIRGPAITIAQTTIISIIIVEVEISFLPTTRRTPTRCVISLIMRLVIVLIA
ncbi:hypothetical protein ACFX2I_012411 [Malus domestica]